MMPIIQIDFLSYKMEAVRNSEGSERMRVREKKRGAD